VFVGTMVKDKWTNDIQINVGGPIDAHVGRVSVQQDNRPLHDDQDGLDFGWGGASEDYELANAVAAVHRSTRNLNATD